ncbi:hypothetical protein U9M48_002528, partial [Paspalum notatum var. saurae]
MSAVTSSSVLALPLMIWLLYSPSASSLSFSFDFSKTGDPCGGELVCKGDAHFGNATIELTTTDLSTVTIMMSQGQVWYGTPVPLWDAGTGEVASFATAFSFNITRMMANSTGWGDGMAFFLAPYSGSSVLDGSYGGGLLGLFDNADHLNATGSRRVVAVEFDTHLNSPWDASDQHVGIDVNSIKSMTATVRYDNVTRLLAVDLKIDDHVYRVNATIDVRKVLPQDVAVGFSAGTGSKMEHHRVLSWSFNSTLQEAPSAQASSSKSKSSRKFLLKVVLIPVASVMVLVTVGLLLWLWRRKLRETAEQGDGSADLDFEMGIGPRRYTYRELAAATDDFAAGNKLGEGGFGSVYMGRLPSDDADDGREHQQVAIKRFSSESSSQGRKEFEAEVRIISRLRHRNLVQLLGWCDSPKGLLLVYELVPEGSLDEHIHSSDSFLTWPQRYKIILGLGSALHYLHLDWEQCVVHGDIKPRNIMLDSSYNTKLGDFGLARLIDHGTGPQTTGLVQGTVGYIDPEFVNTFQRSTHSDIYSFGIVLLEIVSGRLPASRQEPSFTLLRWVRSLHCQDLTLDAADPRLRTGDEDDDRQMERALIVGLWCAHPDPAERPSVAQAMHALQSEYVVGLPALSPQMYKQLVAPPSFALAKYREDTARAAVMDSATAASLLLVVLQLWSAAAQPSGGCPTSCGNVSVPYPFGIGTGCSFPGFDLACDRTHRPPRLLLGDGTLHVLNISLANYTLRALNTAGALGTQQLNSSGPDGTQSTGVWSSGVGGPYVVSEQLNQFVLTGCNAQATLLGDSGNIITGCSSVCSINDKWEGYVLSAPSGSAGACSGIGCCQTPIPIGRPNYTVQFRLLDTEIANALPTAVRVAERGWFDAAQMLNASAPDSVVRTPVPVVLEWALDSTLMIPGDGDGSRNSSCPMDAASSACRSRHSTCHNITGNYRTGYVCQCERGYDGNPYLAGDGGCQDINECAIPGTCFGVCTNTAGGYECRCPRGARGNPFMEGGCVKSFLVLSIGLGVGSGVGLLLVVLGGAFVTRRIKHRAAKMLKRKFFNQNRGHLLQQLVSQKADIAERMIIPLEELEKATNNFDTTRELGGGGHGTVYKGILSDQHVVAIKKSKVAVQREIDEFINEVAILSQINHRNVVKLFGCCLETQVSLLVYEFIPNGTLYEHLHVEIPASLPWRCRLRIATESARALAYLHMAVSFPIIHRDIKSHNILLDGSLTAKVSDFGASRCIPSDQTGISTAIQGTFGYLDPMYYYTGRLTDKSDVFSFGVVLIELLTRRKPYSYKSPKEDGLVAHFTTLLSEGNLANILDPQVVDEGGKEVREVATLAATCVKLKAEDRPTKRQVEMTLESIQASMEQVLLQSVTTNISDEKQKVVRYLLHGDRSREESSRQYSLEEEFLLSA